MILTSSMRPIVGVARRLAAQPTRAAHASLGPMVPDPTRNLYPLAGATKSKRPVLLLKGDTDTIGKEVTSSLGKVLEAADAPTAFVKPVVDLVIDGNITNEVDNLFSETRVAVKGPYFTPPSSAATSLNIRLRQHFDLFANIVHAYNIPGIKTRHEDVDIVIIRENTEGEYSGLEHAAVPGVVESLKIITEAKSMRIAEYAFQYAIANQRSKITAVHKANIMKGADGLFLDCCTRVSKKYPFIEFDSMIVDNTCMQMTSRPQQFDVMLLPNLYGNIVTNIATGLVGGPGLFPGTNIGLRGAVFEQGSRHSARSLAGQGVANPTATILSGALMLRYLKLDEHADRIHNAVMSVFRDTSLRTRDISFDGMTEVSTDEFTASVIARLR